VEKRKNESTDEHRYTQMKEGKKEGKKGKEKKERILPRRET
jgi:hypothetical protein